MSTTMQQSLDQPDTAGLIERVVMRNDLAQLSAADRFKYVRELCRTLGGLNPLTRPFQYITLNGRLTLYVTADGAEQLRKIHGVSVRVLSAGSEGDLFIVRVEASDRSGRTDSDLAAVPIAGLKGEALANAMMKTVTKAKRRLTLSICGLGLLDETEVASVPSAIPANVDMETGEILEDPTPKPVGNGRLQAFTETLATQRTPEPPPPDPRVDEEGNVKPADTRFERQAVLTLIARKLSELQLTPSMQNKLLHEHCGVSIAELDDVTDPAPLASLLGALDTMARTRKISHRKEPNT